jgi:hypothetical protein
VVDKFDYDLFKRCPWGTLFTPPSFAASHTFTSSESWFAIACPPLPVLFDPSLVVFMVVQYAALLQMAPVLEISPRAPTSGAEGVFGLARR